MTTQDKANKAAAYRYPLFDRPSDDNQLLLKHWQGIYAEGYMRGLSELWQEVDVNNIPNGNVLAKIDNENAIMAGIITVHSSGRISVRGVSVTHYIEIETLLNILKETK